MPLADAAGLKGTILDSSSPSRNLHRSPIPLPTNPSIPCLALFHTLDVLHRTYAGILGFIV